MARAAPRTTPRKPSRERTRARPTRTRLEVDERRAQLIARGIELFGSRAYDEVSIDEISRTLGISKGLLYHYFPTKKDFYGAVVAAAAESLLRRTLVDESLLPEDRLRQGVGAYLSFVRVHRRSFVALMRGGTDAAVAGVVEGTRELLLQRILGALPLPQKEDPGLQLALRGWVGFVEALSLDWVERDDVPIEVPLDLAIRVFFTAVGYAMGG